MYSMSGSAGSCPATLVRGAWWGIVLLSGEGLCCPPLETQLTSPFPQGTCHAAASWMTTKSLPALGIPPGEALPQLGSWGSPTLLPGGWCLSV